MEEIKYPLSPKGYCILCEIVELEEVSEGGIILSKATIEKNTQGSQFLKILEIGPDCYTGKMEGKEPRCKVGDIVITARYMGTMVRCRNHDRLRLINDDDVMAVVNDIRELKTF